MNEQLKINEQIAELINTHGYATEIVGEKIIPDFKENVQLETFVYATKKEYGIQTRFDIGVYFKNGAKLYEAFGDLGENTEVAIHNNIENFSRNSLHVFLDAFNDTEAYCEKEQWKIGENLYAVFAGDFNLKSSTTQVKEIELPENLAETVENIITHSIFQEDYYFIRFYYAQMENESLSTEFMINNVNMEQEEKQLEILDWMKSEEFYSVRNFMILKRIQ